MLILLLTVAGSMLSSCQAIQVSSFAIYRLTEAIPAAQLSQQDIGQLELQNEPILSNDDIVSYGKVDHTIELTHDAYVRIQQLFPMPVKVDGIPFVVCVGKERIYLGAFWTPLSSLSYDGIVIMQPLDDAQTTIQISVGYPAPEVFTGNDPRADPRIIRALEQMGKLK
ncbi:MAG: hypothetical protein U0175_20220 [Caldilineaceae bacterium]